MSYTPPLGNSVEFKFTGGSYTPPYGDSIQFEFASPTVAFNDVAIPYSAHFFCSVDVVPVVAFVKTQIALSGVLHAEALTCGRVLGGVVVKGDIPGVGHIAGSILGSIIPFGAIQTVAAVTGIVSASIPISGQLLGGTPYKAAMCGAIPLIGSFSYNTLPIGTLAGTVGIKGLVNGERGNAICINSQIKLRGNVVGAIGKVVALSGIIPIYGSSHCYVGRRCVFSGAIRTAGALICRHTQPSESVLGGTITLSANFVATRVDTKHPLVDSIYVRTASSQKEVFSDV